MSEKLTADKSAILEAYEKGDQQQKNLLENIFGTDLFNPSEPVWLTDLRQACNDLGIDFETVLPYKEPVGNEQEALNAYAALRILAKWHRKGWEPDWNNASTGKYYPVFRDAEGFGIYGITLGSVVFGMASALYFDSTETARDFATSYIDLYRIVCTK